MGDPIPKYLYATTPISTLINISIFLGFNQGSIMKHQKYQAFQPIKMESRKWPNRTINKAPEWCSVDLRDGNQSLINPMNLEKKLRMYHKLVEIGFKQIEVGFPSASTVEYDFLRHLIDKDLIPEGVTVQVLCQAREYLIQKTFESLQGCKRAIFHLYNSTSTLQRKVVFKKNKQEIINMAVKGTKLFKSLLPELEGTEILFQYSPESFTGTELDYGVAICEAVMEAWQPKQDEKVILNLPATVEMSTPNIYADQIEWFINHFNNREKAIISLHNHNDRGTAVAAVELALMAGADRVEGTLFGSGERTGNVDIVTLALNLFSQGVDSKLDFSQINSVIEVVEHCNELPVHQRHPYAGELVYTAFSGSHQDAIKKGISYIQEKDTEFWEVPYLPVNPDHLGRTYEAIIRINSQSGKGGASFILAENYGYRIPKAMEIEFGKAVQTVTESTEKEVLPSVIQKVFKDTFVTINEPFRIKDYSITLSNKVTTCEARIFNQGKQSKLCGKGNGPIDALVHEMKRKYGLNFQITDFSEHALEKGSDAKAVCYVQVTDSLGNTYYGAGIDENTITASLNAVIQSINRMLLAETVPLKVSA